MMQAPVESKHWTLRESAYQAFHRWPLLVALVFLGGLLGWGVGRVWPPDYQATVQVYVGLNPYRAWEDTRFLALARPKYSNLDDYKNWQMAQLEALIFLDEILRQTLRELNRVDPAWQGVSTFDLRLMLRADWRSAGAWSLVAQSPERDRADQAVQTWSRVAVERVEGAVLAAQQAILLDQQLQTLADEQERTQARLQQLNGGQAGLRLKLEALLAEESSAPLELVESWETLGLVSGLADFSVLWQSTLAAQPAQPATAEELRQWLALVDQVIIQERRSLLERAGQIEAERLRLVDEYARQMNLSLGLSPNLEIQNLESLPLESLRPTGALVGVGGLVGLLAWLYAAFWEVSYQRRLGRQGQD